MYLYKIHIGLQIKNKKKNISYLQQFRLKVITSTIEFYQFLYL